MKTNKKLLTAATLLGAFALMMILPADVSSAEPELSAYYDGTHVQFSGKIQGPVDQILFAVWDSQDTPCSSEGFVRVINADGSFSENMLVKLKGGIGYKLQVSIIKMGEIPIYRTVLFDVIVHPTGVSLSNSTLSLNVGGTHTLTATVSPADATNKSVTWTSSDPTVATVSNGLVTALKAGTATITVRTAEGSFTATCAVNVTAAVVAVTGVSVDKTNISLAVGGTSQITATVSPSNATNKNVTWTSSDPTVATVNNGLVTAVKAGTATITVRTAEGSFTATCAVNVTAAVVAVTGVSVDKSSISLTVGGTSQITETVSPSNATNKNVTWTSSDPTVATVNNGLVTARAAGTATITVTTNDGHYTATCSVTVNVAVTGVTIDKSSISLTVGGTSKITETVSPANATDKSVTWTSSNPSVATVDSSGLVTARAAGTATITVTTNDGHYTRTCSVTVSNVAVTGVTIDKSSISLTVGGTSQITATVSPADATDKSVTWASSNPTVATVSNGLVTARAAGTATITVTTNGGHYTATCSVTVNVAVAGVTIDKSSISLTVGGTSKITATVLPANATDKSVTWTSSNSSVATVDSSGLVTARAAGTATITVTTNDGHYTRTCSVTAASSTPGPEPGPGSYRVNLASGAGFTMAPAGKSVSPVPEGETYTFTVSVAYGYDPSTLKVRVNGVPIVAGASGIYTISGITEAKSVTAEVSLYTYAVNLPTGDGYVVKPAHGSSSPVNHGGSFLFEIVLENEKASIVVKANGNVLEPASGIYTISNITSVQDVTVEYAESDSGTSFPWWLIVIIIIAGIIIVVAAAYDMKRKRTLNQTP